MPRLAIFNMAFGFGVLFLAAAAGAFVATDITAGYLQDKALLDAWSLLLTKSAHGHTNLFALTHIAFGVTMPYSTLSFTVKRMQTFGLMAGTVAMGPGMLWRAALGPSAGVDLSAAVVGTLLSLALVALFSHAVGLSAKLMSRT